MEASRRCLYQFKHIKETVKALEGEKEPTINKVLERRYVNHQILDEFINDSRNIRCKYGITLPRKLKELLEKRFSNKGLNCQLRRSANYLDPKYKGMHLLESGLLGETLDIIERDFNSTEDTNSDISTNV